MILVPPLEFYYYSPYSMEGTSLNNGKLNSAFFNTYKSTFGPSTNIALNYNPTKFSPDTVCATCNKFATIFLSNDNDELLNPIGNQTLKFTYLKLDQLKNIYNYSGINLFNIYDENQFNYGTIICNGKDQFFSVISDSNGNNGTDIVMKKKIIYADGYYNYLNYPIIPDIQNEINILISNGIRKVIIPQDPSKQYIPNFITGNLTGLVPSIYYSSLNSTFANLDLKMEEYNLSTGLYLDNSIKIQAGEFNVLSVLNENIFDKNLNDNLSFTMYNVDNSSPLINSGNIFGLSTLYNYETGSIGYTSPPGLRQAVIILYADNDFDYLNYNDDPSRFNTFVIEVNPDNTRTIYLPPKPINFKPPTIVYPENIVYPDKIIYNKFYGKPSSNSSIFDNTNQYQNITLFTDLYDNYDSQTGLFGNQIGKLTIFSFILVKNNQTYSATICYFSFFNNEYITSVSIVKNSLDKVGALTPGQVVKGTIIASSDGYGFNSYFVTGETFKNYYFQSVGYI